MNKILMNLTDGNITESLVQPQHRPHLGYMSEGRILRETSNKLRCESDSNTLTTWEISIATL